MEKVVSMKESSTIKMISDEEQEHQMSIFIDSQEHMNSRRKDLEQHVVEFDSEFVNHINSNQCITLEQMLDLENLAHDIVNSYLGGNFANDDDYEMMRVKLNMQLRKDAGIFHYVSTFFTENRLYYNYKYKELFQ